eukprot:Nitzschia sp. Nitz4//scaffold37_size175936//112246//115314//NITZ4_002054-RA/size175936-processed-gene-0.227-mRNA-1//-1//CDS//3329549812//6902//frame0
MTDATIRAFVSNQRELLSLELEAETDEQEVIDNEERASHILGNLDVSQVAVGLYGRTVVELTLWSEASPSKGGPAMLPAHRFTVGDEVEIRSKSGGGKGKTSGVISAVSDTYVSVALFQTPQQNNVNANQNTDTAKDEESESGMGTAPFSIVPRSSVEVHRKLLRALDTLEKKGIDHPVAGNVIKAMFSTDPSNDPAVTKGDALQQPFNARLDESQRNAISFALQPDRPISLIHGPPGTGKTTTVAELIQQAVHNHGMKVLVAAPSNVAVDNILERLMQPSPTQSSGGTRSKRRGDKTPSIRAVRLGHPARIKTSILSYSLEALVQKADGTEVVADVRKELQSYLRVANNPKSRAGDKRAAYREIKVLRKEIRTREEKVVRELIGTAQVVLATTIGADNRILDRLDDGFDLVVIDEAAQALEASCWIPILRGKKVVLAGDHCQLPPTIKSHNHKAQSGLGNTMFERLMKLYGDDNHDGSKDARVSRMLSVQYRMNESIAGWASEAMYHGKLETHESVRNRVIADLEGIREDEESALQNTSMLLVDTAGCDLYEGRNAAGSRFNEGEASIVARHVRKLLGMGVSQEQVCIISPYNGQVELLRNLLKPDFPKLEIRSVDGFQGGERDAVILSLVRSSERGGIDGIGFLRDDRRQNVAVTRAKRHLMVVCDSETVSRSKFIGKLLSWIQEHGELRSAMDYVCGDTSPDEADLMLAEDLLNLAVAVPSQKKVNVQTSAAAPYKQKPQKTINGDEDKEKRKELMNNITAFVDNGQPGDELALSVDLSKFDRRVVHEFAEQNHLGHRSEGTEGKDRRVILTILKVASPPVSQEVCESENKREPGETSNGSGDKGNFSMLLDVDESDESEGEADSPTDQEAVDAPTSQPSESQESNSLLAQLAKEREERQRSNGNNTGPPNTTTKSKKKKSKGQKLGGAKKPQPKEEEDLDDLDDMAFLDAQIDKAQNAHGRKVAGKGKGYRTIVNGILNARPDPRPKATNTKASSNLQSKLKDAQNARKSKGIPSKKR